MSLPAPLVESHNGFNVVRDDLLPGGTKMRFILPMMEARPEREFVYASPAFGYAQVALAHCAALAGRRATVFTAKRKVAHPLTVMASRAGARVVMVPHGYLSNVQAKARMYAERAGAYLVPFGVEIPEAMTALVAVARAMPTPCEVWSVAGSGVLTRSLQAAWPSASFHAVMIGKADSDIGRARRYVSPLKFEQETRASVPFPSSRWYDAKAWEFVRQHASPGALFWNVGG